MTVEFAVSDDSSLVDSMRNGKDVLNFKRDESIVRKYCLYLLLQCQRHRKLVLRNNKRQNDLDIDIDDLRDQGFVRPRVLILLPFRDSVYKFVNTFISVFESCLDDGQSLAVSFKRRFKREFGPAEGEGPEKARGVKPADYEATFAGNIDDHFALGMSIARRTVKLFTPFSQSDIIVISPIRMSRLINEWAIRHGRVEKDEKSETDMMDVLELDDEEAMEGMDADVQAGDSKIKECSEGNWDPQTLLSSIEILIVDQADVLYMQNWMHVMTVMEHLNKIPQTMPKDANYFRCRLYFLEGSGAFHRQTLVFSRQVVHSIQHHLQPFLQNKAGRLELMPGMCETLIACPGLSPGNFNIPGVTVERQRVSAGSTGADPRLSTFKRVILPDLKRSAKNGILIFTSTPADRLKLHQCLHCEDQLDVGSLHEDMTAEKQQSARHRFQLARFRILIFSERLHFFRRWKLKGVHAVIFYRLPIFPHFFPEICKMMERSVDCPELRCQILVDGKDPQDVFTYCRLFGEEKAKLLIT